MAAAAIAVGAILGVCERSDAGQFDGVTLSALVSASAPQLNCLKLVAAAFEADTGARLRFNALGYTALHDAALAAFAAGTGAYDVVHLPYQWTGEFADPGFLIALDPYLSPADTDGMIARSKELYGKWKGAQVALPYNGEAMLLFYRRDLLEKAGLAPPQTWDDWSRAMQALTRNGMYGTAIMGFREQAMTMWSNRYWGLGGGSLDPDQSGVVTLNKSAAVQALDLLKRDVTTYSPPGALSFSLPEASAQFTSGRVAMIEMWPSFLGPITLDQNKAPAVVGQVAVAQVPGGRPHSGGWGLGVTATSKHRDAAVAFIRLASSRRFDQECFARTGKGPVYADTYTTEGPQYWLKPLASAIAAANPRSRGRDAGQVNDMFDQIVSRVLAGEVSAVAAVDEMQARLADAARH